MTGVTKAVFCSIAISKQLNAAPYLSDVYEPFPQLREETVPAELVNARDSTCALVSFPKQRPWLLVWERDWMCACVKDYKIASFATDSSRAVL